MANLDILGLGRSVSDERARTRHLAHVQRAQQMLVAAGLAALCVIGVAGAFLSQVM